MKNIIAFSLMALMSSVSLATPITLQHSKTSYVNSGICSAVVDVTIHDFLGTYDKLYLDLVAKDKAGKVKGTSENVITYGDIQNLSGKATTNVFIESETMCGAGRTWTVQVKRAVLVVDGKREDLLKVKKVHIDDFQPMKFKVAP
ncbi:IrmA family protein [Acinetobacter johnsonii]|uniref:IrmA family protein n=1 Tax=Acinetobacter johnsonii TaxID=40214 RepID=UPI0024480DA9|nr:IrmA family protein [Acinetobacter johnsonii]MDH1706900.1 IrmA family protein [Acinetobacter johnsonii]